MQSIQDLGLNVGRSKVCSFSAQQMTKIGSVSVQAVPHPFVFRIKDKLEDSKSL